MTGGHRSHSDSEFAPFSATADMPSAAEQWKAVDEVCNEFERAWKSGARPVLHDFADRVGPAHRVELLYELAAIDQEYRCKLGEPAVWEQYTGQFPELRGQTDPSQKRIGRYDIEKELGRGAQGIVYLARHPVLDTPVVIKWATAPAEKDAVIQEGRALAQLGPHEHLVRVYDCDIQEGRPFLVLECVNGTELSEYVRGQNPDLHERLSFFLQIADTVQWLHGQNVAHQDLKPENVLVAADGCVKLIDFGLVQVLGFWRPRSGDVIGGTPKYMAPEVARLLMPEAGEEAPEFDYRAADVFSLGGILFFLLTGHPPYLQRSGETQNAYRSRVRRGEYNDGLLDGRHVPPSLARLCRAALAGDRAFRLQSPNDLARGVREFQGRWRRRRWMLAGSIAGAMLLAVLGGILFKKEPPPDGLTPAAELNARFTLYVHRNGPQRDLPLIVPVYDGEPIAYDVELPPSLHAASFLVNGQGRMKLLQELPAGTEKRRIHFPAMGEAQRLTGPAGTELLFVCGRLSAPVDRDEVLTLWNEATPDEWPGLPETAVLYVEKSEVWFDEETSRDLGDTVTVAEGPLAVRARLDDFRTRLMEDYDFVSGVAFPHLGEPLPEF